MRYSKLIAFFFAVAIFGMFAAFGQTTGTPASQAPAAGQAQNSAQPLTAQDPQQNPSPNMQPPAAPELGTHWRRIKVNLVPHKVVLKQMQDLPLDPQIDQGIYLRAASSTCGTIVSYNFSQGDNPQLHNITTCTPSQGVKTLRTQDEDQRPQGPLLQKTNYSPSPKQ